VTGVVGPWDKAVWDKGRRRRFFCASSKGSFIPHAINLILYGGGGGRRQSLLDSGFHRQIVQKVFIERIWDIVLWSLMTAK
jgi:hypothetical protein